jgi:hypothetical protein
MFYDSRKQFYDYRVLWFCGSSKEIESKDLVHNMNRFYLLNINVSKD